MKLDVYPLEVSWEWSESTCFGSSQSTFLLSNASVVFKIVMEHSEGEIKEDLTTEETKRLQEVMDSIARRALRKMIGSKD